MSDKTLLNEGTIRRFMKLAEIDSLASPFVERLNEQEEEEVDDEMGAEEEPPADMEAEPDDMEMDVDMDMEAEPDDMEMDMDEPAGDNPMADLTDGIAQAVTEYIEGAIEDGTLEITQGDEMEAGDELDLEAEPEGEPEGDELADAGAEVDALPEEEPAPKEEEEAAVVAEVARRVTKRILSSRF